MGTSLSATAQDKRYHGDGIDDYLRFVPLATVGVMRLTGQPAAHDDLNLLANVALSTIISCGTTWTLKSCIHSKRPDGTDNHSFPSGHTTFAFSGATILHKEYGRHRPWLSIAGYGVATVTAVDRIRRNRHHWGDVVAGAAIGVLGTEAGYFISGKLLPDNDKLALSVSPTGVSLAFTLY